MLIFIHFVIFLFIVLKCINVAGTMYILLTAGDLRIKLALLNSFFYPFVILHTADLVFVSVLLLLSIKFF